MDGREVGWQVVRLYQTTDQIGIGSCSSQHLIEMTSPAQLAIVPDAEVAVLIHTIEDECADAKLMLLVQSCGVDSVVGCEVQNVALGMVELHLTVISPSRDGIE
jgi:hypothetical protein